MRERATALAIALALALGVAACGGGPEANVINQYFTALRANDTNTLTSFATVQFDQKVDSYKIVSVGPEARTPATLPELVAKQKQLEADLAKNNRDAKAWGNDLNVYPKLDEVRSLEQKGAKIPAALEPIHQKWTTFNDKDRELKKGLADAKAAVEREKRIATLSLGQLEDLETLKGDVITKDVDLTMTVAGQAKPYVMTLRKYDVSGGTGSRLVSRWVVFGLTPKS
ncbi:MAG: hypothetical protein U0599_22450 [Vicinamibacteria bacterium]